MGKSRIPVPLRIGLLLLVGLAALVSGGIITYQRLVGIIDSFQEENRVDTGLPEIRDLTTSIEQAENYIRLYGITRNGSYLVDYNQLTANIDSSITQLYTHYPEDAWFKAKIDTIQLLFVQKKSLWKQLSKSWQSGATSEENADLSEVLRTHEPREDTTRKFLSRLFSRKKEDQASLGDSLILNRLNVLEEDEKQFEKSISRQEAELAVTSNMLSEAFISLVGQLNEYQQDQEEAKIQEADQLAGDAYKLMTLLTVFGVILGLFGLVVLVVYFRKNKAYNEILIRSKKDAEEMARSKEQFIANVSHEIRTPLNAVIGFIKQLLYSDIDEKVKEKLKIVDSAGDQLIRLINDVLDFSKLQAGNLTLENSHFEPEKSLSDAAVLFEEAARRKGNVIEMDSRGIRHRVLYGDTLRFQQILFNLLSNAVKFTENGTVRVVASTLRGKDHITMEIIVKDSGPGIEESKLDTIFDEYTQAGQDITVRYGGTGLGLSIVKKLVELFNGNIEVESRKGVGTEVRVQLEFLEGDVHKVVRSARESANKYRFPENMRILVADDEVYNLALVTMILDKWNISYDKVNNGLEAVELIKGNRYDAVLMDLRMPVINGISATRFIRETLNLREDRLPVIGITADTTNSQDEDLGKFFNRVLVKPFTEEELYAALTGKDGPEPGQPETGNLSNLVRASGNDKSFVKMMIDQFEMSTSGGLEQIGEALGREEYATVGDLAHKIAPPSRHLGITGLYRLLKEIEERSGKKEKEAIGKLMGDAEQILKRAVESLNQQFEALKQ